jgi:heptosyltransferase-3
VKIRETFDLPDPVRRLLVIQLGDIGDVVWTVPTLASLHAAWPSTALSLLVHRGFAGLMEAEPYLHRVFQVPAAQGGPWERIRGEWDLIRSLRRERFDGVIDLRSGDRGAFMARLTGASLRIALWCDDASALRNRLFTHLVCPVDEHVRRSLGAAEQSLRIVRALGVPTLTSVPFLHVSSAALASAEKLLGSSGVANAVDWADERPFVTLNPFSRWAYKEWPLERWARVIDWVGTVGGAGTVVVGQASERERAESLARACPGRVLNVAGRTSLAELAALLSRSRLHVGVDSAAPHIAAAVGTPTVTLYGPTDWRDWAPVGERHRVVVSDRACVPCHRKGCEDRGRSLCLEDLSVERIQEAVGSALALPKTPVPAEVWPRRPA